MPDNDSLALVHAEIDGELEQHQRAELARRLLSDPASRATRDELHRLCARLDAIEQVEPPPGLLAGVLAALPQAKSRPDEPRWSAARWRLAAAVAGILVTGAIVYSISNGPRTASDELVGTLADSHDAKTLDSAVVSGTGTFGRVSLQRVGSGLQLAVELAAGSPVDLRVASGTLAITINDLGAGQRLVELPGFQGSGQPIVVSFLAGGHEVARAQVQENPAR